MKKILLDTNAYSNLLRGDEKVFNVILDAEKIYLSVIVIAELLTGFRGGNQFHKNKSLLDEFKLKETVECLGVTSETAEIFSELKVYLHKKGTPIPINDIWIAAHTVETGSVLITYDAHFKNLDGMRLWY
ncbi:MAG: type II toxin-antitoxin system VapC family toxin [Leptospiraceae bacterium]|nr:type II toxin-antitoxin system VapC family toxin [Leptospiraceae bacterium]